MIMMKSTHIRLIALILCIIMSMALFACDKDNGTPNVTDSGEKPASTEAPTDAPSDDPTQKPEDDPTEPVTEMPTEKPAESDTENPEDKPAESDTEKPEDKPVESDTDKPEDKPAESDTEKPEDKPAESDTEKPEDKPAESDTDKPEEEETDPEEDKPCADNSCTLTMSTSGGVSYTCSVCGTVYSRDVSEDVNFFSSPGQALNNWGAGYPGNGSATWNHTLMVENGRVFERIVLGDGASFKFDNGTSAAVRRFPATSAISGGSGRYLVIRVRANDINFQMKLILNSDTSAQGSNTDLNADTTNSILRPAPFKNGEWNTYVIDLKAAALPLYPTEDAEVKKIAVGFDMAGFVAKPTSSLDFEYVAICDGWSEIASIVEEDTVMYSGWRDNDPWKVVSSEDGGLPVDTEGEDAAKVIYQKTGTDLYVYIRSPYTEKYTMYKFAYLKNDSTAYEGWMIKSVAICDTDLNVLYYASKEMATDLEGALQEYNTAYQEKNGTNLAGDFIGGGHGDEQYKTIKIVVDGVELDMSRDYLFTACESIVTVVESDVFRWDTTEKVFDRTKTISWTEAGMEITNSYKTVAPITIYRPAVGMLVVYRDDSGYNDIVTKHWDNISNKWIDVVWPDKPTGNHHQNNMTYAKLDGKYVCASLEIKDFGVNGEQTASIGWFNYDSWYVGNQRVKIYLDIFRMKELKVGDVMHSTAVHTIFAKAEDTEIDPGEGEDPGVEGGECSHEYKREKVEDDWVISCSKCDYKYEYGLTLSSAQRIYYPYELGAYSNMGSSVTHTDNNFDHNGPEYMRLTNITSSSSQMVLSSSSTGERYIVIKFRVGKNGLGQTTMQFYAPSNLSSSQNYGHAGFAVSVSEDGEWHTVVIDLAARVAAGGYNTDENGEYNLSSLYVRPYGNKQAAAVESKTAHVDIAYIAICDELSDISGLVGEDTYEWSVSSTENEIRSTETHEPVSKTE